jgi:hypothetical protein
VTKALWLLVLLGSASAWGQTITPNFSATEPCPFAGFTNDVDKSEQCEVAPPPSDYPLRIWRGPGSLCNAHVEFHGKSKQIKDIFPSECQETKLEGPTQQEFTTLTTGTWETPEPPDVPAVQEDYVEHPAHSCWGVEVADGMGGGLRCVNDKPDMGKRPGCADKSRILLTAEDGAKWCHKVQP